MRGAAFHICRFLRRRDGSATVEVLFAVVILNIFMAGFLLWWGAYNSHAIVDRATYTVSDLITRQRGTVLQRSFLDGLERTAEFLIDSDQDAALRFTQVTMVAGATSTDPPTLRIDWSYSPCGMMSGAVAGAGFDTASLPAMAVGASMIVTEMRVPYVSTFDLIPSMTFERRAVALYRFEARFDLAGAGASSCPT